MQHLFLLLLRFQNKLKGITNIQHFSNSYRDKQGRSGEGEGIGKTFESERLLFINCSFSRHNNFWQCFVAKGQCIWRAGTF